MQKKYEIVCTRLVIAVRRLYIKSGKVKKGSDKGRLIMAVKRTKTSKRAQRNLSLRQIEDVFKKLAIPVLEASNSSAGSKTFEQFSLVKYVDVIVETSAHGGR